MKKTIVFIVIFCLSHDILTGQLSGTGTILDPYYGVINNNTIWYPDNYSDNTIYARSIEIAGTGQLTVSPGIYNGGNVEFLSSYTLTINEGGAFTINPQTSVTVDYIVNNGTLTLESSANEPGVASLIHYNLTGNGTSRVKLYLPGGQTSGGSYKWHYVSVPITGISITTFNTLNLAQYIENLVTGPDNFNGWVAWDGYQYSTGNTLTETFSELELGIGYNYFSSNSSTFTLSGGLNISDQVVSVTCGTGYPEFQGYNLIGNPFLSCLDWDDIIHNHTPENIYDAIYFTNNGQIASYVGGIGANGGSGTIPPMQGFFVKASANSTIVLPATSRIHNLDQARYKKKNGGETRNSSDTISFIRLKIGKTGDSSDIVIRFNRYATASFDKEYDAFEFSKTAGDLNLWTTTEGINYSINGLPYTESTLEIPLGICVKEACLVKLSAAELKNLDNYMITLKDNLKGCTVDIRQNGFIEYDASPGITENRFVLILNKSTSEVGDILPQEEKFKVYTSHGYLNIFTLTDDFQNMAGSITISDISGKMVYKEIVKSWNKMGEGRCIMLNALCPGIYVIELRAGSYRLIKKVSLLR